MVLAWRMVRQKNDGTLTTLFHGIRGSRVLERGKWIRSESKFVRSGTGGRYHMSAFNVFNDKRSAEDYLSSKFKRKEDIKIIPVLVDGWEGYKPSATAKVSLFKWMFIPDEVPDGGC